jgi:hypothetical protein
MSKVKMKTVPLTAMDFIQDAYDVKNYVLYNEQDRISNFKPNEAQEKAQSIVKKIEYIAAMVNLDNVFKLAGYTKQVPIEDDRKDFLSWKFNSLATKKSKPYWEKK